MFVIHPNLSIMRINRSQCPLVSILDILGDKWSLVIIRDLFLGKKTFTEFMKSPEKFASNILSNRLELLINSGLLKVTKLPNDKKTKLYYLTDKGIDLYPIVYEMMYWSKRNLNQKFNSLGVQFFKESKNVIASEFIKNTQSDYINFRNSFLSI
jgi:DNA-binding HxlR family transcriptional regulator